MGPLLPVISAVATVGSFVQGQRAASAQQRAFQSQQQAQQEQQRAAELQARRSRTRAIRESQILRSRTQATSQALGATGSSAMEGGLTSLSSQLGGSLGYQTQASGINRNISRFAQQATGFEAQAAFATGQAEMFSGLQRMTGISPRDAFTELFSRNA